MSLKIARGELELLLQSYRKKSKLLEHFSDSVKLIQDASEDDFNTIRRMQENLE